MKSSLIFLLSLISLVMVGQNFPAPPDPPRLVNDFAGLMSPQHQQQLESKLSHYNDSTSTQIAVVTVNSLNGYDVAGYSFELAEQWGIGQQGKDNGILILIAPNERRMFIATGYGVEAYVPDAIAKRIVEGTLKPNFRQEQYYRGLDQATNLLMGLMSGQFSPEQLEQTTPAFPWVLTVLLFIVAMYLISRVRRGPGAYRTPGGHTYRGPIRRGPTWTDFSKGSGTFGGGGGGGFGGFGGGSFGGGGAGGSW